MKSRLSFLISVIVMTCCLIDPSTLWADPLFRARMDIPTVTYPQSVTIDDLSGDGIPDLVVAKEETDTAKVFRGKGDGTFQVGGSFPTAEIPLDVVTGDLDGNGSPDLVVCCLDLVSVLLGNGGGTFGERTDYDVGDRPTSVAIDDLNGDGHLDLVVANYESDDIAVLLGIGDGTFPSQVSYPADDGPVSIAVGDLDNDACLDLVVANSDGRSVRVRLGNGDGTFQGAMQVTYWATGPPGLVSLADLDGDGVLDLVAVRNFYDNTHNPRYYSVVQIGLGNGDGTFRGGESHEFEGDDLDSSYASVAIGDLDCDGSPDLAVTNNNHDDVTLLINDGAGVFQVIGTLGVSRGPRSIDVADLDGDGILDLATANRDDREISVILGADGSSFHTAVNYLLGGSPRSGDGLPGSVAVQDLDADGELDLAVAHGDVVEVLMGIGDGTFQSAVANHAGPGADILIAEDFNGDGVTDLATGATDRIALLPGNGDGTFQEAETLWTFEAYGFMDSADLDNNSHPDLVAWMRDTDELLVLLCNGDGTFQDAVSYPAGDWPYSGAVSDLNGDGAPDLVCSNYLDDNVSILLGNGDGTFQGAVSYPTDNKPMHVVVGDWNDDGSPDLATANYTGGTVSILLGNGDGTFQNTVHCDTAGGLVSVSVGDLDNDGNSDLVTASSYNSLSVLLGNGDGTFQDVVNIGVPGPGGGYGAPRAVHIADLDGDTVPDLTVLKSFWYNIAILIGNGDGTFGSPLSYGFDSMTNCLAIDDLDGNGDPDLVVMNTDAQTLDDYVSILLNDRGTVDAELTCVPSFGTLPFPSLFQASMTNLYEGQTRRFQYTIDVTLAGDQFYSNWRRGWQNIQAGENYTSQWTQTIPDLPGLEGVNLFEMTVADVTPPPYNLPPYPPAGDMDRDSCTITGVAP